MTALDGHGETKMAADLDKIDLKILKAMQEDASRSAAEIAEAVGLSQSPCWRRIQRLKDEGYISKIVAVLNPDKLNLRTQMFVQVKMSRADPVNLQAFAAVIRDFPEVMECHVILGAFDFLLRIVAQDIQAYEKFFFEKLARVPGIQEVNSYVGISEIKATTALPLKI